MKQLNSLNLLITTRPWVESWLWLLQGWGGAGIEANWKSCGHSHSCHIPRSGNRDFIYFLAACNAAQGHQIIPLQLGWVDECHARFQKQSKVQG